MSKNRMRTRKKKPQPPPKRRMRVKDALDLVDDDLPDGAYFAMLSEISGCEYGELGAELANEEDE